LFSAILLAGLKKQHLYLIFAGALGAGLTRSAVVIFVPCILFLLVMNIEKGKVKNLPSIIYLIIGTFLSVAIVISIQYFYTNEAFGFLQTHKHWGHTLGFPKFPYWFYGRNVSFTEVFSLGIGLWSMYEIVLLFLNRLKIIPTRDLSLSNNSHFFSLAYLSAVSLVIISHQQSTLSSLNRYVIGVVYFWGLYDYFKTQKNVNIIPLLVCIQLVMIVSNVDLICEDRFSFKSTLTFYGSLAALLVPLALSRMLDSKKSLVFFILGAIVCFILQIHYYHHFLKGEWLG
jgi:hypothetical protein